MVHFSPYPKLTGHTFPLFDHYRLTKASTNAINSSVNYGKSVIQSLWLKSISSFVNKSIRKYTLRSLINVHGDKFSKKNKRTGRKSSSISVQE